MYTYDERRIVSYAARYCAKGNTLEQVIVRAGKRRPPFAASEIRRLWPAACQSVRNAELIQSHLDAIRACYGNDGECVDAEQAKRLRSMRLCDLPGCVWPSQLAARQPQEV